jgi:Putative bacterial sensory transduction regulator
MVIEKFGPQMIERFLREHELKFLVDQDGDFWVALHGEGVPDYRVILSVEGHDADILCIRTSAELPYPDIFRDRVESFIAGWNRRMRWPKAYIHDDARRGGFRVIGENQFPLATGIHPELLDDFIVITINASRNLLAELAPAVHLPTADQLESWLRETG